jgi:hypothetical protein
MNYNKQGKGKNKKIGGKKILQPNQPTARRSLTNAQIPTSVPLSTPATAQRPKVRRGPLKRRADDEDEPTAKRGREDTVGEMCDVMNRKKEVFSFKMNVFLILVCNFANVDVMQSFILSVPLSCIYCSFRANHKVVSFTHLLLHFVSSFFL